MEKVNIGGVELIKIKPINLKARPKFSYRVLNYHLFKTKADYEPIAWRLERKPKFTREHGKVEYLGERIIHLTKNDSTFPYWTFTETPKKVERVTENIKKFHVLLIVEGIHYYNDCFNGVLEGFDYDLSKLSNINFKPLNDEIMVTWNSEFGDYKSTLSDCNIIRKEDIK